mgnify:CR=1 FL=1
MYNFKTLLPEYWEDRLIEESEGLLGYKLIDLREIRLRHLSTDINREDQITQLLNLITLKLKTLSDTCAERVILSILHADLSEYKN